MNFHSDDWIMDKLQSHYTEALTIVPADRIIGIFYQGSGNYGMDYEDSDVDTKLIITPTLEELCLGEPSKSYTHIRENDEHIDVKDIRDYISIFIRQNLNFLEILYTKYCIINPMYADLWGELVRNREKISTINKSTALKAMVGIAKEKFFAMEHLYPSRMAWIQKYQYDTKQLHHLLRMEEYIQRFLNGETSEDCLMTLQPEYLVDVKRGAIPIVDARELATKSLAHIEEMYKSSPFEDRTSDETVKTLKDIQSKILRKSIIHEIQIG